jgi:UrcA family protein
MNRKNFWIASIVSGLAVFTAISGLAQTAKATQPNGTLPSQKVYYGDLKLDSASGVEALYGRIKSAARTVCNESVSDLEFPEARVQWQECFKDSIARAIAQVNNERLTALHTQSQSKRFS